MYILNIHFNYLQSKLSVWKQNKELLDIYLECLSDMLINFEPFQCDLEVFYNTRIYLHLKFLCENNEPQYIVNKVLSVFSTNMHYFSSNIINDYEKWHITLNNLCDESIYFAIETLRSYYQVVFFKLSKEYKENIFLVFI